MICPYCGREHPQQEQIEEAILGEHFSTRLYDVSITMKDLALIALATTALDLVDPRFKRACKEMMDRIGQQTEMEK